jgi:6-phosphogluconolactonase/glucosamine-6-phosphate isomerase/deaminase
MRIEALADADSVARAGAALTAAEARAAVAARGRFIVAFSGGHTPWQMLRALADEEMPWAGVHVVQVDERVAPAGDPDRNPHDTPTFGSCQPSGGATRASTSLGPQVPGSYS